MNVWKNQSVAGLIGFVAGVATLTALAAVPNDLSNVRSVAPETETAEVLDLRRGFVEIADAVVPGVVRIETMRSHQVVDRTLGVPPGFEQFFGVPRGLREEPIVSGGTGFVVEDDGYVLTNHHVVDGADRITVWLEDGRSFDAEFIGSDPTTDVAVLQIEADRLAPLKLADSDRVRVGEWVVAIGNPGFSGGQALDETVTAGIVSAIGRPLSVIRTGLAGNPVNREMAQWAIEDFIQTDAVINPGNSGGPLVDLDGHVVGMNTAIMSTSGYYQGYGFSIPINLVRGVMDDLIEHGQVRRAWLGVQITDVTAEDAEAFDLSSVSGVLVQGVNDGGPGEDAGLGQGDVILSVDGTEVERVGGLQQLIARLDPGQRVTLEVLQDGELNNVRVRLGEAPINSTNPTRTRGSVRLDQDLLGLQFEEASAQGMDGVYVAQVEPAGPAARRGVVRGARVGSLNGEDIQSLGDLAEALEGVEEGDIVSLVLEDDQGSSRIVNLRARAAER